MSYLVLGGSGLLGSTLRKLNSNIISPTSSEININNSLIDNHYISNSIRIRDIECVIHCAGLKNEECSKRPIDAIKTNIVGTANVVEFCNKHGIYLVYISTDYVFRGDRGKYSPHDEVGPISYYGETKLAGEYVVRGYSNSCIIRLSFFPDIFPFKNAFFDQITTRIPVSQAAARILSVVNSNRIGIVHLPGKRQTTYEYALSTSNGAYIEPILLCEATYKRPRDTSLVE